MLQPSGWSAAYLPQPQGWGMLPRPPPTLQPDARRHVGHALLPGRRRRPVDDGEGVERAAAARAHPARVAREAEGTDGARVEERLVAVVAALEPELVRPRLLPVEVALRLGLGQGQSVGPRCHLTPP